MKCSDSTKIALLSGLLLASFTGESLASCGFKHIFSRADEGGRKRVKVYEGKAIPALNNIKPLLFLTDLKVNTDGTTISYHQHDIKGTRCVADASAKPCAINLIRHAYRNWKRPYSDFIRVRDAGYPPRETWKVLSSSIIEKDTKKTKSGKPCITSEGYLVSMTADVSVPGGWTRVGDCDQSKWIDALKIPSIVLPQNTKSTRTEFSKKNVKTRNLVIGFTRSATKRVVHGIVGDYGPVNELGEASVAMNRKLNGLPESAMPKHRKDAYERFQAGYSAILLFPGAKYRISRPLSSEKIEKYGAEILKKIGGASKVYSCIKKEVMNGF